MSLLLVALAAASAAPAGDMPIVNPKAGQPANCPATSRYEAARRGGSLKPQKLGELPDADLYKAVYRHIGRCEVPIIVKYGVAGR
ncbi:MAG TPA: hypothetical protein VF067_08640 [Sphingomicrobium sp.]